MQLNAAAIQYLCKPMRILDGWLCLWKRNSAWCVIITVIGVLFIGITIEILAFYNVAIKVQCKHVLGIAYVRMRRSYWRGLCLVFSVYVGA